MSKQQGDEKKKEKTVLTAVLKVDTKVRALS